MRLPFFSTSAVHEPTAVKDKKNKKKSKSKNKGADPSCSPTTVMSMEVQRWGTSSSSAASTPSSSSLPISSSAGRDQSISSKTTALPATTSDAPARPSGGGITKADLAQVLRQLDENVDAITPLESDIDAGALTEEDVALLMTQMPAEEELLAAFRVFDADGDGKITADELRGALAILGDDGFSVEDCRTMIREVDSVGDGVVCFPDFAKMMLNTIDVK